MTINSLEGKFIPGIIVGGGDSKPDPLKAGRVQVAPLTLSPRIDVSTLPWCQLSSSPKEGFMSFDRPPPHGTLCQVYYPPGSEGSLSGVVVLSYNQVRNPKEIAQNTTLFDKGWFDEALKWKPNIKGFAKEVQKIEQNSTGAEKVTTQFIDNAITSLSERINIPSNLINKTLVKLYDSINNVSTAKQESSMSMTPDLAAMLPGKIFDLTQILNYIPNFGNLNDDVKKALNSLSSVVAGTSPLSGTNFAQTGNRIDEQSFAQNLTNMLSEVSNLSALEDLLFEVIKGNPSITGSNNLQSVSIQLPGPFGNIKISINADGSINNEVSDLINSLISGFSSFLGGIQVATGSLLGNSSILTDSYKRLPLDIQQAFKDAVGTNVPAKIGSSINKSKGYLG